MTDGISIELSELIALRRHAQNVCHASEGRAARTGSHLSKLRGRGMDFDEVRNYQAGDEVRHMEWRVTARTGRPHVKLYQEARERPVVILADFSASMYFGTRIAFKSVVAAQLAALIAWVSLKQGDRVGGLLFSALIHNEFLPRSREAGVLPILAGLSQYSKAYNDALEQTSNRSLSHALLRLRRVAKPGSMLVLISDFYNLDKDCEQHLNRLRRHNDILVYHVCDPLELAPPKPQSYPMSNGKQQLILDTTLNEVNQAYQGYCNQRITDLQELCMRLQVPYMQLTAETNLSKLVRESFPRRLHG